MSPHPVSRILVAVDFGTASARAVSLAGALAAGFGAQLSAVYAETVEVPPYFTHDQLAALEEQVRAARQRASEEVSRFVAAHTAVPASVHVADGPAVDAILAAAHEADLIVVGTHGRRGPARWWLGSVAERVVREAHAPVLVVHGTDGAASAWVTLGPVLLTSAAGAEGAARRWAEALAALSATEVREGPAVGQCDASSLEGVGVLVVPVLPRAGHRAVHEAAVALARTCQRPVLFVPIPG